MNYNFDKDEFIANYNRLKSSRKMGELYHCDPKTILKFANLIGYKNTYKTQKLTKEQRLEIVNLYGSYESAVEIGKKYGIAPSTVRGIWQKYGKANGTKPVVKNNIIGQKFNHLLVKNYTDQRDASGSVLWECVCDCGRTILVTSTELKNNYVQSCGFCINASRGNSKIERLLLENNIPFVKEYKFNDCRDSRPLPFDFYVENKYLIEYDGAQHFDYMDSGWNTENHYKETKKHDKIKDKYCLDNNIPLIRIPFNIYNQLTLDDLKLETSKYIIKTEKDKGEWEEEMKKVYYNMKIELLSPEAIKPEVQLDGSAGYDISCLLDKESITIQPNEMIMLHTGLAFKIPDGFVGFLHSRSGQGTKRKLINILGVSVIDSNYTGELIVPIVNVGKVEQIIQNHERIAQLVICPYITPNLIEVKHLDETARGDNGFGSSGRI